MQLTLSSSSLAMPHSRVYVVGNILDTLPENFSGPFRLSFLFPVMGDVIRQRCFTIQLLSWWLGRELSLQAKVCPSFKLSFTYTTANRWLRRVTMHGDSAGCRVMGKSFRSLEKMHWCRCHHAHLHTGCSLEYIKYVSVASWFSCSILSWQSIHFQFI